MSRKDTKGFTIVELLIVIVVIAILAAISIVAYTGIQNRSKTSAAQTVASQLSKKAIAWSTITSAYPTYAQLRNNKTDAAGAGTHATAGNADYQGATDGPSEAKLESTASISQSAPTSANGQTTVQYVVCGTSPNFTGARIHYFNFTANAVTTTSTDPASLTVGTC